MKILTLLSLLTLIALPARAETVESMAGDLKLTVPKTWKQEQPSSSMRKAQYRIPAIEGEKEPLEVVVFFFGAGGGGGIQANMQRWIGQFNEEGRKSETTKGESREGKYHLLSVTGTFNKSMGGPFSGKKVAQPGSRMLAAIIQHPKGNYFLKCTGAEKSVDAARAEFLASFGAKL